MVSMLVSSAVDRGFEPRSGQTNDYKIGICCFSTKHVVLRRKGKDWLARNQDNVSSGATCLPTHYKNLIKRVGSLLKQTSSLFHLKLTCSRHDIAEKLLSWR